MIPLQSAVTVVMLLGGVLGRVDDAARHHRAQHGTLHRPSVERRVAALRMESVDRDAPWFLEIEDNEIRLAAGLEFPGRHAEDLGGTLRERAEHPEQRHAAVVVELERERQ